MRKRGARLCGPLLLRLLLRLLLLLVLRKELFIVRYRELYRADMTNLLLPARRATVLREPSLPKLLAFLDAQVTIAHGRGGTSW